MDISAALSIGCHREPDSLLCYNFLGVSGGCFCWEMSSGWTSGKCSSPQWQSLWAFQPGCVPRSAGAPCLCPPACPWGCRRGVGITAGMDTLPVHISYLLWHQQELVQAGDTELEMLFPCLKQRGPSQGQSGPAGQQMGPGPKSCGMGVEVAACGCL